MPCTVCVPGVQTGCLCMHWWLCTALLGIAIVVPHCRYLLLSKLPAARGKEIDCWQCVCICTRLSHVWICHNILQCQCSLRTNGRANIVKTPFKGMEPCSVLLLAAAVLVLLYLVL